MKHLTVAHSDPSISAILDEFGPEGYGIYWLMLEHVAAGIEKNSEVIPSRTHSAIEWSKICGCSARRLRSFTNRAHELRLISVTSTVILRQFSSKSPADRLQIDIPKLLKYRDEYSQRSGQAPEQEQKENKGKGKTETHSPPNGSSAPVFKTPAVDEVKAWFDQEFWPVYPRRTAKEDAIKAARKNLTTVELRSAALAGIKAQLPDLKSRPPDKIPHPATWINGKRWNDELPTLFPGGPVSMDDPWSNLPEYHLKDHMPNE